MKIVIKEAEHRAIRIWLPSRLLLNRPAVALWYAFAKETTDALPCTKEQLLALIKTIHACRRTFPGWTLVEVQSADGDRVEIKL